MAILFSSKVWDGGISGLNTVYTDGSLYRTIAQGEKWYVEARVTQVSGTATVAIALEHSSEGSAIAAAWVQKASLVSATSTPVGAVTYLRGSDLGTVNVGASNMRVAITLAGTTPSAYVELWLTVRSND